MTQQATVIRTVKKFGDREFTTADIREMLPNVRPGTLAWIITRWKKGDLHRNGSKETKRALGKTELHVVEGSRYRYFLVGNDRAVAKEPPTPVLVPSVPEVLEYTIKTVLVDQLGREWVLQEGV